MGHAMKKFEGVSAKCEVKREVKCEVKREAKGEVKGEVKAALAFCILHFAFVTSCSRPPDPAPVEPPSSNVTSWTDKTELYMEYPPLVTGETVRFAVHLTRMADFGALNAGRPSI